MAPPSVGTLPEHSVQPMKQKVSTSIDIPEPDTHTHRRISVRTIINCDTIGYSPSSTVTWLATHPRRPWQTSRGVGTNCKQKKEYIYISLQWVRRKLSIKDLTTQIKKRQFFFSFTSGWNSTALQSDYFTTCEEIERLRAIREDNLLTEASEGLEYWSGRGKNPPAQRN